MRHLNFSTSTELNDRLMRGLGFSTADLAANRSGELTPAQRELLTLKKRLYVTNGQRTLLLMWAAFTTLIIVSLLVQGLPASDLAVLPAVLACLSGFFVFVGLVSRFFARHLLRQTVTSVQGRARTKIGTYYRYGRKIETYELLIGRRKFHLLSQQELSAFEDGALYRVYYVPYAPLHVLLSAEALE